MSQLITRGDSLGNTSPQYAPPNHFYDTTATLPISQPFNDPRDMSLLKQQNDTHSVGKT